MTVSSVARDCAVTVLAARWQRHHEYITSRSSRRTSVVGRMALSVCVRATVSEVSALGVDKGTARSRSAGFRERFRGANRENA